MRYFRVWAPRIFSRVIGGMPYLPRHPLLEGAAVQTPTCHSRRALYLLDCVCGDQESSYFERSHVSYAEAKSSSGNPARFKIRINVKEQPELTSWTEIMRGRVRPTAIVLLIWSPARRTCTGTYKLGPNKDQVDTLIPLSTHTKHGSSISPPTGT